MTRKRTSPAAAVAADWAALLTWAPAVVAQRVAAAARAPTSLRTAREHRRMITEKAAAASDTVEAVTIALMRAQWELGSWWLRACFPNGREAATAVAGALLVQDATTRVASALLAPSSRRVTANARRLARRA
ncbi:MAG TPA: hypothetical protein VGC30_00260 [Dokdonella sp.]